jgi:hypothetical protein
MEITLLGINLLLTISESIVAPLNLLECLLSK